MEVRLEDRVTSWEQFVCNWLKRIPLDLKIEWSWGFEISSWYIVPKFSLSLNWESPLNPVFSFTQSWAQRDILFLVFFVCIFLPVHCGPKKDPSVKSCRRLCCCLWNGQAGLWNGQAGQSFTGGSLFPPTVYGQLDLSLYGHYFSSACTATFASFVGQYGRLCYVGQWGRFCL